MNFCRCCILGVALAASLGSPGLAQLIVAHRGASYDAPENTLAAFEEAWRQGADAIEGDFYLTQDKQIACIHDADTERVAAQRLAVSESTLQQLQGLDVGSWKAGRYANERIPTLKQVVETVPPEGRIFVEVKCGPEIVPYLGPELRNGPLKAWQVTVISFQSEVIREMKRSFPEFGALWLVRFKEEPPGKWSPSVEEVFETAIDIAADGVDCEGNTVVVDEDFVEKCRANDLSLHVWTIDEPRTALHFQSLGVESITTNKPAQIRAVLFAEEAAGELTKPGRVRTPAPAGSKVPAVPAGS